MGKKYPTYLNTKRDYECVRKRFPYSMWKADFNRLLDVLRWFPLGEFINKEGLTVDDTHKIDEQITGTGEEKVTKYLYSELRTDPNAKIFRIGYTVERVKEILAEGAAGEVK